MLPRVRAGIRSVARRNVLIRESVFAAKRLLSVFRPGNVVMFHLGRSGSTVLGNMLDQRPDVLWSSEVYQRVIGKWESQGWSVHEDPRPFDPIAYMKKQMIYADRRCFGVEVNPSQLRALRVPIAEFVPALADLGFGCFILLSRRNILRSIVSAAVVREKRQHHQPASQKPTLTRIALDLQKSGTRLNKIPLLDLLQRQVDTLRTLEQALGGLNVLQLVYEDDIEDDPQVAYQKVCDFVGLKPYPVVVDLSKTNPFPLRDILINYEDVRRTLQGTPFEWMIES
jgi:hypothetical protein